MRRKILTASVVTIAVGAAAAVVVFGNGNVSTSAAATVGTTATVTGGGTTATSTSVTTTAPTSTTADAAHKFRSTGARDGAGQDRWLLTGTELAVTRDNGRSWNRLPLPSSAQKIASVAVLSDGTAAVTGAPGASSLSIDTYASSAGAWQSSTATVGAPVDSAAIVDDAGKLKGVMVDTAYGSGVWLSSSTDGSVWQATSTPAAGTVTAAGGALWLTNSTADSSTLYESTDDGSDWSKVTVPAGIADSSNSTAALSNPQGTDGTVALTATSGGTTRVVIGTESDGQWSWSSGPTLSLGGSYGSGTPARASAVADGVLWVLSPTNELARVNLSSGAVTTTQVSGLPANGELSLDAISAESASADYSTTTCADGKSDCVTSKGIVTTSDGGKTWTAIAAPTSS